MDKTIEDYEMAANKYFTFFFGLYRDRVNTSQEKNIQIIVVCSFSITN
jgi:hypothetical protein